MVRPNARSVILTSMGTVIAGLLIISWYAFNIDENTYKNYILTVALLSTLVASASLLHAMIKLLKAHRQHGSALASDTGELLVEADGLLTVLKKITDRNQQEATTLDQTAAALRQIRAMVDRSSEAVRQSHDICSQNQSTADEGRQVAEKMLLAIDGIHQSQQEMVQHMQKSQQEISGIVKLITEIESKTKVINEIAFQTKLLSFNASIEAARAGQHGKGFAVVASEVGNLANMSSKAADQITSMLGSSSAKVQTVARDMQGRIHRLIETGNSKVDEGTQVAKACGDKLSEILQNAQKASQGIQNISAASQEQASRMQEAGQAIEQLGQLIQFKARATARAESISSKISQRAQGLQASVENF